MHYSSPDNNGVCVAVVTYSKDLSSNFYRTDRNNTMATRTAQIMLINVDDPNAQEVYTPSHVVTRHHFENFTIDNLQVCIH